MPEFLKDYGTEVQSDQTLEAVRWMEGFRWSRCEGVGHHILHDDPRKVCECTGCRHQALLVAVIVFI